MWQLYCKSNCLVIIYIYTSILNCTFIFACDLIIYKYYIQITHTHWQLQSDPRPHTVCVCVCYLFPKNQNYLKQPIRFQKNISWINAFFKCQGYYFAILITLTNILGGKLNFCRFSSPKLSCFKGKINMSILIKIIFSIFYYFFPSSHVWHATLPSKLTNIRIWRHLFSSERYEN